MAYTYEELRKKTVAQLREIAKGIEHEALHGYSTMHKEQLLNALYKALEIDTHKHHSVVGIDKSKIKAQIRELKVERDTAIDAHDHKKLKEVRHKIHRLKRILRRSII